MSSIISKDKAYLLTPCTTTAPKHVLPKSRAFVLKLFPSTAMEFIWEFREKDNRWKEFDKDIQEIIEDALEREVPQLRIDIHSHPYIIALEEMVQTNVQTQRTRPIRRRSKLRLVEEQLQESENRLAETRFQAHLQESKLRLVEEQLQESKNRLAEAQLQESKLRLVEEQLQESKNRLAEAQLQESKLRLVEEQLQESKNRLAEAQLQESKLRLVKNHLGKIVSLTSLRSISALPPAPLGQEVTTRELGKCEPEYDYIVSMFQNSMVKHRKSFNSAEWCERPMVEVTLIESVVNPVKQPLYVVAREEVKRGNPDGCEPVPGISAAKCQGLTGSDLNEYFLFHGSCYQQVSEILREGLDPQRGGESAGSMFGKGTYFAENASKADMYTTCD